MGNNKFKFSDMIPNAWFYKLKDMSKTRSKHQKNTTKKKLTPIPTNTKPQVTISQQKHANNKTQKFTTETPIRSDYKFPPPKHSSKPRSDIIRFPEVPPRKSTKLRRTSTSRRKSPVFKPIVSSQTTSFLSSSESSSSETDFPDSIFNVPSEFDSESDFPLPSWPNSCNCRLSSSTADIIIDLNDEKVKTTAADDRFVDVVSEMIDLPPILTKPMNFDETVFKTTKNKSSSKSRTRSSESHKMTHNLLINSARRSSSGGSSGIRLRTNSPRLASKKIQAYARKSVSSRNKQYLSESFAVVKSSVDPQRDFRDSMVEMIVENNIRASKDLEELLACYLSLNSKEYHDVIVKAFEQIWFDMADIAV